MTQQIADIVRYEGAEYDLLSAEPCPFDPSRYGLHPVQIDTGCHAGFFCKYAVRRPLGGRPRSLRSGGCADRAGSQRAASQVPAQTMPGR